MSISINRAACIGCGRCVEVCPGNLIKLRAWAAPQTAGEEHLTNGPKKADIKRVEECWGCTSCIKECPVTAISFFLGADIGGMGSTMTVKQDGDFYRWTVTKPDGSVKEININRKDSNKY